MKNTKDILIEKMEAIHDKCYGIYQEHGGYDYHDEMHYQLRGLDETIGEASLEEETENLRSLFDDAQAIHEWFQHVEKIRVLQKSMPEVIFG